MSEESHDFPVHLTTSRYEELVRAANVHDDLVAALRELLSWHDPHPVEPPESPLIARCRAALAKARGETP